MGFLDAIKSCFNNYAQFSGRARRSEFWYWTLFNFIVSSLLNAAAVGSGGILAAVSGVYSLAVIIPSLAVSWRRVHDIGKSGWAFVKAVLMPIFVSFVIMLAGYLLMSSVLSIIGCILLLCSFIITVFVCFVWMVRDSEPGPNKYGPNPKSTPFNGNYGGYGMPGIPENNSGVDTNH